MSKKTRSISAGSVRSDAVTVCCTDRSMKMMKQPRSARPSRGEATEKPAYATRAAMKSSDKKSQISSSADRSQ
eukprot:1585720-Pleurochrysis_carterae.AAC.1